MLKRNVQSVLNLLFVLLFHIHDLPAIVSILLLLLITVLIMILFSGYIIAPDTRGPGVAIFTSLKAMNIVDWLPGWKARAGYLLTTGGPLRSRSPRGPGAPGSSCTQVRKH